MGLIPGSGRSPGGGNGTPPVFLLGESHGQRSLLGYRPWGPQNQNMTECPSTVCLLVTSEERHYICTKVYGQCNCKPINSGSLCYIFIQEGRFSRVRLCATPETAAHQAPPSLGFSRQEHWSGLPFPSPIHESEK